MVLAVFWQWWSERHWSHRWVQSWFHDPAVTLMSGRSFSSRASTRTVSHTRETSYTL